MTALALCGGLLGVLFMIPLRRFLIVREHRKLPYPEGTACAEVLVAAEVGGSKANNVFLGLLRAVFNNIIKIGFAELVLRLDVAEDDFVERCPELVVRDIRANSLQILLR